MAWTDRWDGRVFWQSCILGTVFDDEIVWWHLSKSCILTTSIDDPNNYDVLHYLWCKPSLPLILERSDLRFVEWWLDAAFTDHPDIKSHAGDNMLIKKGFIIDALKKQKVNTKSFTGAKIVSINDLLPWMIWAQHFVGVQGYHLHVKLHQDNQASSLIELNSKAHLANDYAIWTFVIFVSRTKFIRAG